MSSLETITTKQTGLEEDADKPTASRPIASDAQVVVVVGNGMVGYRFCKSLAEKDPEGRFCLRVIGEEPSPAYDRIHLSDNFLEEKSGSQLLADRDWYQDQSIELFTGDPVTEIDRDKRQVRTHSGKVIEYDHLVMATGSAPFVPPVEGTGLEGVYVYRTAQDVIAIKSAAQSARTAAVIGGGLLGLEAAQALRHLGLDTSVIEFANGLMPRQLDMAAGQLLRERVEEEGVSVLLRAHTQAIVPTDRGLEIRFANRPTLVVDFVVISAGIRPRDELARACGLDVAGAKGGIIVDDQLKTSDPNVYAIGECAIHRGKVYGLAAPGYQMADALASQLMGDEKAVFKEGDLSTRLKLVGTTVGVFGRFDADCRSVSFTRPGLRRTLLIRSNRLIGAIIVGDWDQISVIQEHAAREGGVSTRMISRFRSTGDLFAGSVSLPVTEWPANRLVCNCMKVSRGDLSEAIAAGCDSVASLVECTGAGSACGSCKPLLAKLADSPVPTESMGSSLSSRMLIGASLLTIIGLIAAWIYGPIPLAEEFTSAWYQVDQIWRIGWIKQTTGFVLLGLSAVALLLSVRKRVRWLSNLGGYSWYRVFHSAIGALCLVGLAVHTGMHMGQNLNFYLMCVFLGLTGAGALAGVVSALEAKGEGAWAIRARRWRPVLTWVHIVLFWPLPVLVGFHIAAAYLY